MAFKKSNVRDSFNVSGNIQNHWYRDDGPAWAITYDMSVSPPLIECWFAVPGIRGDIITWQLMEQPQTKMAMLS